MKSAVVDYNSRSAMDWLQSAAEKGFANAQYELGRLLIRGDQTRGIEKNMEYVAPAYQNGRFGYPVDLLKSKALVELLVEAYSDGRYGVDPDAKKQRYWTAELKYFDRLFDLTGGSYLPLADLQRQAAGGDLQAQYQLGHQLLVAGPAGERAKGLQWIEREAAEGR